MSPAHQHDPATAPHPLEGALGAIRVLDFTQIAAGPLCTILLADMGADVLRKMAEEAGWQTSRIWTSEDPEFAIFVLKA
jgi:crotonobetainyl-CoA:carnitine CoA-transferase CaiB-like acyl-CoA transferase